MLLMLPKKKCFQLKLTDSVWNIFFNNLIFSCMNYQIVGGDPCRRSYKYIATCGG